MNYSSTFIVRCYTNILFRYTHAHIYINGVNDLTFLSKPVLGTSLQSICRNATEQRTHLNNFRFVYRTLNLIFERPTVINFTHRYIMDITFRI